MAREDTLAVIATHLRPAEGFGGVAESTAELILAWRSSGRPVRVAVSNGSRGRKVGQGDFERHLDGPVLTFRAWLAVKWGFGLGAPIAIYRALRRANTVYVSGIATWPTTLGAYISLLAGKPCVIAPRGGLMAEHWRQICETKPLKKLYYRLIVFPSLRRAKALHVSSPLEASGVKALLPDARLIVAPNVFRHPDLDPEDLTLPQAPGLNLLYLGRLSQEKGILGFARWFAAHRREEEELVIVGPAPGDYGAELVEYCKSTPGLRYAGQVDRSQVPQLFKTCHALVLPSGVDGEIQENFGNVVLEALLHGRPAMVTRGLAWDELEEAGAGAVFERSLSDASAALDRVRAMAAEPSLVERCRTYAVGNYSCSVVAGRLWSEMFAQK